MQDNRSEDAWKARLQRMRAELESTKAERDGLRQLLQQARAPQQPGGYMAQAQVQNNYAPHGMAVHGQPQGGRGQGLPRGPMPALRGASPVPGFGGSG